MFFAIASAPVVNHAKGYVPDSASSESNAVTEGAIE